jgi:hypothetical protein
VLGKHPATTAVTDATNGVGERRREVARAVTITFEQVECNTLRGLLPDARHAAQTIDQSNQ